MVGPHTRIYVFPDIISLYHLEPIWYGKYFIPGYRG